MINRRFTNLPFLVLPMHPRPRPRESAWSATGVSIVEQTAGVTKEASLSPCSSRPNSRFWCPCRVLHTLVPYVGKAFLAIRRFWSTDPADEAHLREGGPAASEKLRKPPCRVCSTDLGKRVSAASPLYVYIYIYIYIYIYTYIYIYITSSTAGSAPCRRGRPARRGCWGPRARGVRARVRAIAAGGFDSLAAYFLT